MVFHQSALGRYRGLPKKYEIRPLPTQAQCAWRVTTDGLVEQQEASGLSRSWRPVLGASQKSSPFTHQLCDLGAI